MKVDEFDTLLANAQASNALVISDERVVLYPFFDIVTKGCAFSAAYICRVVPATPDPSQPDEHSVVVSFHVKKDGSEDFSVWCADKFLEGRMMKADEAQSRAELAAESAGLKGTSLVAKFMDSYGIYGESNACDFWSKWRKDKVLCPHTAHVLAKLRENRPGFRDELKQKHASVLTTPTSAVPGELYSLEELAFRIPVLFEGDRGAGKTFEARAFARAGGYSYIEANGHEGIEAPDLLGFLVPTADGSLVWKDGPLSKAFRSAKTSKTVLVIDEMLRIRQRELSVLLTAFSPDNGVYRLPTGRILRVVDGVGEEEVLEAPVENLAVIATTNVGSEYAVDALDPALAERFIPIRKDTEVGKLTQILTGLVKAKGFKESLVKSLVEFFKKMVEAKKQGLVADIPTTRTLSRAVELAATQDDVVRGLRSQVLLWVDRDGDGHPVQEQIDDCVKLLERLLPKK